MNNKVFRAILIAALSITFIIINVPFIKRNDTKAFTLPSLPRPIAKAPIAITSAGQSTDIYIIHDIANQLMIRNLFVPQAVDVDFIDIKTIVFVVGYSSLESKYYKISYEEEKSRIENLLKEAKDNNLTVITIILGEKYLYNKTTLELLKLVGTQADYIIGLKGSSNENILTELAKKGEIPLTLVGEVKDISGPFASAFR